MRIWEEEKQFFQLKQNKFIFGIKLNNTHHHKIMISGAKQRYICEHFFILNMNIQFDFSTALFGKMRLIWIVWYCLFLSQVQTKKYQLQILAHRIKVLLEYWVFSAFKYDAAFRFFFFLPTTNTVISRNK